MSETPAKSASLSNFFENDPWFKFTEDVMDGDQVTRIIDNRLAPANRAHNTSAATLEVAAKEFLAVNGDSLLEALEHLKAAAH